MNANAQELYDKLAAGALPHFHMDEWGLCGSPCCIGGWAASAKYEQEPEGPEKVFCTFNNIKDNLIGEFLGLPYEIADKLFYPEEPCLDDSSCNDTCSCFESYPLASPWHHMGSKTAYKATQQDAARALKRACEMSETKELV